MHTQEIRRLRKGEEQKLAHSVSPAFFEDPMTRHLMPDEQKRQRTLNWLFTGMLQYCRRWGKVYTNNQLSVGSAWMLPGHTTMSGWRILRTNLWQMPFRMGLEGSKRFGEFDADVSAAHDELELGDHWYLLMLGTAVGHQGTGIGSSALEVGKSQAFSAGYPVYLETMTERNVDYYTNRGFKVVKEHLANDQVKVWSMLASPD